MNKPISKKVGRIVTCFGQWHWINRWLDDEALLQPFVEWVVINDKPSDPPPDHIRKKIARFGQLIEPPANMGRSCARNLCVHALASEWVDIIDGDDIPKPLAEDFDASLGNCGLIFFDVAHHIENPDGSIVQQQEGNWAPPPFNQLMEAMIGHIDCRPAAVMWRRRDFLRLGGFDGRADYVEDLNLCIRARLAKIPIAKVRQVKASYQRASAGRVVHPIIPVANLRNFDLARPLVTGPARQMLEEQIEFYSKALLWAGMKETEKSKMGVARKLVESLKWIFGRHRQPRST